MHSNRRGLLIAYQTLDEVNVDSAVRLADARGVTVIERWPRDPLPDGQFDAALYDLDFWPVGIIEELLEGERHCPVAVHSYNLRSDQIKALDHKGIGVFRNQEEALQW